jgi:hypothetical protein
MYTGDSFGRTQIYAGLGLELHSNSLDLISSILRGLHDVGLIKGESKRFQRMAKVLRSAR